MRKKKRGWERSIYILDKKTCVEIKISFWPQMRLDPQIGGLPGSVCNPFPLLLSKASKNVSWEMFLLSFGIPAISRTPLLCLKKCHAIPGHRPRDRSPPPESVLPARSPCGCLILSGELFQKPDWKASPLRHSASRCCMVSWWSSIFVSSLFCPSGSSRVSDGSAQQSLLWKTRPYRPGSWEELETRRFYSSDRVHRDLNYLVQWVFLLD